MSAHDSSSADDLPVSAYIALGSNLGDRRAAIESAIAHLHRTPGIAVGKMSSIIETSPVGPPEQGPYLNAAAELRTAHSASELLSACLRIEAVHGRHRQKEKRWGPRRLDIDLLLYGDRIIDEPGLRVPHPRMADRRFVLEPLAQIAPRLVHPELGISVQCLLDRLASLEYRSPGACSSQ